MPRVTQHTTGVLRTVEVICFTVGILASALWGITTLADRSAAHAEIRRFEIAYPEAHPLAGPERPGLPDDPAAPNFDLWSPQRIAAWQAAQSSRASAPLGILRVPRLSIEAAVLEGTDDATLNRAVGHIAGTPLPGADGNAGIAGHRDSFFRRLKDIAVDDAIEIALPAGTVEYRVVGTEIVKPVDVWVLDPSPSAVLTLVTCYPFHFVGSAPQRFVVRAVQRQKAEGRSNERADASQQSRSSKR
jgi:sortase A